MLKIQKTALLLSAFSIVSFAHSTAYATNESIGVNSAVKGDVTIQSGEQQAKQAVIKEPVLLGDVVKSNEVGSLQVLLKDQTVFTVGPDCNLTIDKFVYDPTKDTNSMSASVQKGMFRFMSGNISKSGPDSVSIETPIASMGIRGTMVEGLIGPEAIEMAQNAGVLPESAQVDTENATLFVLRGPGKNSTSNNKRGEISVTSAGNTVIVKKSGMAVFVADKNTPPSRPFELSSRDTNIFHDKLRTQPTGGPSYKPFVLDIRFSANGNESGDRQDIEFFNPETDLQWPTDLGNDDAGSPNGQPFDCSPQNPNYPDC